jgi:hypothetical protein
MGPHLEENLELMDVHIAQSPDWVRVVLRLLRGLLLASVHAGLELVAVLRDHY